MSTPWDFSAFSMTFDNPLYLFDGTFPIPPPPPVGVSNIMPSLAGVEYQEAIQMLQQAGIFAPASLGYFGTFPISVIWSSSLISVVTGFAFGVSAFGSGAFGTVATTGAAQAPGIVLAQSPQPGTFIPKNGPVVLTVSEFPIAVAFP